MTEILEQQIFTGERALFNKKELTIKYSTFMDGESPLKECSDILLEHTTFKWKYPMWYSQNITLNNCTLFDMSRAGIWYSHNISMQDCQIEAPKIFRKASGIALSNVSFSNAQETLWNCSNIKLNNVTVVRGDYFAMNSTDIEIDGFTIYGNYSFDGAKNIVVKNAKLLSKDAFWNAENVTVYDSYICGEYLAWNAKNITFINCTIESNQGMCYIENLKLVNCKLINTDLAFEYCTVDAEIINTIDSIKNPISGKISAKDIGQIIFDDPKIDPSNTLIVTENK